MALNGKLELSRKALEPHGFHLSKTEYMEPSLTKHTLALY